MNHEIEKAQAKQEVIAQILAEAGKLNRPTAVDFANIIIGINKGLGSHINGIADRILNARDHKTNE